MDDERYMQCATCKKIVSAIANADVQAAVKLIRRCTARSPTGIEWKRDGEIHSSIVSNFVTNSSGVHYFDDDVEGGVTSDEEGGPASGGGRDDEIPIRDLVTRYTYGETRVTLLHRAVRLGNQWLLRELLMLGADPRAQQYDGTTPIHVAARVGCPVVMTVLLAHSESRGSADCTDGSRDTALHLAVRNGHSDCVMVLLERALDVDVACKTRNVLCETPFDIALRSRKDDSNGESETRLTNHAYEALREKTNAIAALM